MSYAKIIEVARLHKDKLIDNMRMEAMISFMSRVNNDTFEDEKELKEIKIVEESLKRVNELIEKILDEMEKGVI